MPSRDPLLMASHSDWHRSLAEAIRDPLVLLQSLGLPRSLLPAAQAGAGTFPLMVPRSYLARMEPQNPADPLLRQVLPLSAELVDAAGFSHDAVGDQSARRAPGMLHKYAGRALLIAAGVCAINCRYCFRRHYPYGIEPRRMEDWEPALRELAADSSIHEIILSGGDPLMLTDARLSQLLGRLAEIPHLSRLRVHSRLPIVLPDRVTPPLIELLTQHSWATYMVVHANHPRELSEDCRLALRHLVRGGMTVLNQAVLLRGVNDNADTLTRLCEDLVNLGVLPYYLNQLDRVAGTSHFEVPVETGKALIAELRRRLPGYAVPSYVQEIPGELHKTPVV